MFLSWECALFCPLICVQALFYCSLACYGHPLQNDFVNFVFNIFGHLLVYINKTPWFGKESYTSTRKPITPNVSQVHVFLLNYIVYQFMKTLSNGLH